jgi:hypothetical protein
MSNPEPSFYTYVTKHDSVQYSYQELNKTKLCASNNVQYTENSVLAGAGKFRKYIPL